MTVRLSSQPFYSPPPRLERTFTSTVVNLPTFGLPVADEQHLPVRLTGAARALLSGACTITSVLRTNIATTPVSTQKYGDICFPLLWAWAGQDGIDFSCAGMFSSVRAKIYC